MAYSGFERAIGYGFHDKALLERALTHSSYANEKNAQLGENDPRTNARYLQSNETLEFLGDSILGFIIAEYLYINRPHENEGKLSRERASVICEPALAQCARELGIDKLMKLGSNISPEAARRLNSILSDAMEAVFAAVYIDGGIEAARNVITHCMSRAISEALTQKKIIDHKSRLQEHFYRLDKNVKIVYSVTEQSGPAHMRHFKSQVAVNGRVLGTGGGATKKESEQIAAKEALDRVL